MRREAVRELTEAGLSTRAIAPIVGTSHDTVHRDLRGVANATPGPTVNTETGEVSDDYPSTDVTTRGEVTPAWGPYGTRVCAHCDELISQGRADEVVEELAARMTVRDAWHGLNPEEWRRREHDLMQRWLKVRTTSRPIEPDDED